VKARRAGHDEGRHTRGQPVSPILAVTLSSPCSYAEASLTTMEKRKLYTPSVWMRQAQPMRWSAPLPACTEGYAREDVIFEIDGADRALNAQENNEERTLLCGVSMSEQDAHGRCGSGRTNASSTTPRRASIRRSCARQTPSAGQMGIRRRRERRMNFGRLFHPPPFPLSLRTSFTLPLLLGTSAHASGMHEIRAPALPRMRLSMGPRASVVGPLSPAPGLSPAPAATPHY
jgi:hypothetical protein